MPTTSRVSGAWTGWGGGTPPAAYGPQCPKKGESARRRLERRWREREERPERSGRRCAGVCWRRLGMGEALEAIREVGRRLSGDERAEIGPGCYAPAGAARELERARGGEEGEARPFRAIRIWQADGEREPGKGCEETPAGMFEPFSAEQRAALEALEAKSLAELEAEAPDGARTRLLRQPREAKKIDLGSWRAKREGEGEPTLRKEFGNGGFS